MRQNGKYPRAIWCAAVLALVALAFPPTASARNKRNKKSRETNTATVVVADSNSGTTEINPTNIAVLDDDFLAAAIIEVTEENLATPKAHQRATGRGVVVAVLDGGFNLRHPDIAANVSPHAYDAVDRDFDPSSKPVEGAENMQRAHGHGTFVAGMVLMAAPDATILPIRVVDDNGFGTGDEFLDGLEYAIDMGADIINCSIEVDGIDIWRAICLSWRATAKGIVCVASAGNASSDSYGILASYFTTIAVGSVDETDHIAPFSNVGNGWGSVFAPGVDLYGPIGFPNDDSRGYWSGTSFSAGIISGAVALARQLHPLLDNYALRNLVSASVDPVYDFDGAVIEGAGRINLEMLVTR